MLLTRHGETIYNRAGIMQGILDTPLTRQGILQAETVGRRLLQGHPKARRLKIVASPLPRAHQTASVIAEVLGIDSVDVHLDEAIAEVDWGDWNGLSRPQIAERDPELWLARQNDKWSVRPPNGESYRDLADRLANWLSNHQDIDGLLVVAHGAVSRVLRGLYLDLPKPEIVTLEEPQGVYFKFADGKVTRHPNC